MDLKPLCDIQPFYGLTTGTQLNYLDIYIYLNLLIYFLINTRQVLIVLVFIHTSGF